MNHPLKMISGSNESSSGAAKRSSLSSDRHAIQAKFDRMWLIDPRQFDPMRNAMQRQRISKTCDLIAKSFDVANKKVVDIGCGSGAMAQKMSSLGACCVHGVDVSSNALKIVNVLGDSKIEGIQGCMPHLELEDDTYDLVLSTELVGYLSPQDQRLYVAELARLVKAGGCVVCSTSLDIATENALEKFASLLETEFIIDTWVLSYHAWYIRWMNIFKAPRRFARASREREYREKLLSQRRHFARIWCSLNTTPIAGKFWQCVQILISPVVTFLENSGTILTWMEKGCRFVAADRGISHAIAIGKRRPLWQTTEAEKLACEPKQKKKVWE